MLNIVIVTAYSPTNSGKIASYSNVDRLLYIATGADMILKLGDWRSLVGCVAVGELRHLRPLTAGPSQTDNGERLLAVASTGQLFFMNSAFQHHLSHLIIWQSLNVSTRCQLEHAFVKNYRAHLGTRIYINIEQRFRHKQPLLRGMTSLTW